MCLDVAMKTGHDNAGLNGNQVSHQIIVIPALPAFAYFEAEKSVKA
jgi:hypothetical protein